MQPIRLTLSNYRCFTDECPATIEIGTGFTALLGPNNAGKSALLRSLFELGPVFQLGLTNTPVRYGFRESVKDHHEVSNNVVNKSPTVELHCSFVDNMDMSLQEEVVVKYLLDVPSPHMVTFEINGIRGVDSRVSWNPQIWDRAYLIQNKISNSMYIPPERSAISQVGGAEYYDVKIGQAFVHLWGDMKNGNQKRAAQKAAMVERDLERLLGIERLEVAMGHNGNAVNCHIGGHSYRLDELGHGMQQMLIVLAQAAIKSPEFILIDEPELGLHPSLQIDYLTTLASYAKSGVVFATHNYGLASAIADRIYCVVKKHAGYSRVRRYEFNDPSMVAFAGALHYGAIDAAKEICLILVEGPTDVRVFSEFVRGLGLSRRFAILPMGGSNTICGNSGEQLRALRSLGKHIMAFVDSERQCEGAEPKKEVIEFRRVCDEIGLKCHVSKLRSTECYFDQMLLEKTFHRDVKAVGPFERHDENVHKWGKEVNWRAARAMSKEQILATDIGKALHDFALIVDSGESPE